MIAFLYRCAVLGGVSDGTADTKDPKTATCWKEYRKIVLRAGK